MIIIYKSIKTTNPRASIVVGFAFSAASMACISQEAPATAHFTQRNSRPRSAMSKSDDLFTAMCCHGCHGLGLHDVVICCYLYIYICFFQMYNINQAVFINPFFWRDHKFGFVFHLYHRLYIL